jgi:hypothetical protein
MNKSGFKAGSNPYTVVGTPDSDSGVRIKPPEEMFALMQSEEKVFDKSGRCLGKRGDLIRAAIDRVEKHDFKGKPSGVKMLVRKQMVNDLATRLRYQSNKLVIDYAKKKAEGRL